MPKWVDRTGQKYGMLTLVEYLGARKWRCRCDCGNECVRLGRNLNANSHCGCQKAKRNKEAGRKRSTHGDSRTKLYKRWTAMHQRCENPKNDAFSNYGGRGITVCSEWGDYGTFKKWSIENGYREDLTIDRIDVNGNYEPSNCRWTTYNTQLSNRRPYHRRDNFKPVEALDKNGDVVKRFESVSAATSWLGRKPNCGGGISAALHGRQLSAYGYGWRFVNAED